MELIDRDPHVEETADKKAELMMKLDASALVMTALCPPCDHVEN